MRILITGGTSTVGKHLQDIIPQDSKDQYIFVNSKMYDLKYIHETEALFLKTCPDVVVHLAAKVGGINANINNPVGFFEDNIYINTNTLKCAYKFKVKRFIGILSTCVYPDTVEKYPLTENDLHSGPPTATSFGYGYAKRCLAVQIDAYNRQYKTNYNYVIPCNLYSEYDDFKYAEKMHFITALLDKIRNSKDGTLNLLGTGRPLRQFMYAEDLARVLLRMIQENVYDNFNINPTVALSIDDMAKIALKVTNRDLKIIYSNSNDGQYRKDASNQRMMGHFPNFKYTEFEEGIEKVYNKIITQ